MPAPSILSAAATAAGAVLLLVASTHPEPDAVSRAAGPPRAGVVAHVGDARAAVGAVGSGRVREVTDRPATPVPAPVSTAPTVSVGGEPAVVAPDLAVGERVAWFALARVGLPYVFGAAGPAAYDCSGLTRAALRAVGVDVPHHAAWQAELGRPVEPSEVRPGDLVFLAGGRPRHDLGHVGIAIGGDEWVHASSPDRGLVRERIPFGRVQRIRRLTG